MTDEQREKHFGLGDRSRLSGVSQIPGIGSIDSRVQAKAEERMRAANKDHLDQSAATAEKIKEQENAASNMLEFLDQAVKAEKELAQLSAEAAQNERERADDAERAAAARMEESFGAQSAARNLLMGFLPQQSERFSSLRRIGANELGSGVQSVRDNPAAIADKIVTKVNAKVGEVVAAIKNITTGIF